MSKEHPDTPPLEPTTTYTLEMVASITRIPADEIVIYYRSGVIPEPETTEDSQILFDESAIHQLRQVAQLLSDYQLNHSGLEMVSSLWREIEALRAEVRFLREKN